MTYQQTLDYLFDRLPMFSRIGASAYKKDLHNTLALSEAFDHPERKIKTIHIAGTNGKGSTSHMLAAIFQAAGYKTGLYTSPHLKDFRERIRIDGAMVCEQFVIDFVKAAQPCIEAIQPSFFELTVVMAFEYFAKEKVAIAIIETGLGGRLDSTNIITPELSIITNIGWDHMQLLGDTLEKIAFEKAGIIKQHIPVVVGEVLSQTKPVFEAVAAEKSAPLIFAAQCYEIQSVQGNVESLVCTFLHTETNQSFSLTTDLPGLYQQKNIRTVLTAIDILRKKGYDLPLEAIQTALQSIKKQTGLHGRWEVIHKNPHVILDVGHNKDGVNQIVQQLSALRDAEAIRIIIGMVKDKEVESVLALFPKSYHFYFTNAHLPRALPVAELQKKAESVGLYGNVYENVNDALGQAIADAGAKDIIVVCGSVFVVGEVAPLHTAINY